MDETDDTRERIWRVDAYRRGRCLPDHRFSFDPLCSADAVSLAFEPAGGLSSKMMDATVALSWSGDAIFALVPPCGVGSAGGRVAADDDGLIGPFH